MLTAETRPSEVSSPGIGEEKYISSSEELALASRIDTIINRKNAWGLEKGQFYHEAYQLLGEDRLSRRFGGFSELVEHLHKSYRFASVSRAYELKRAYEQYVRIIAEGLVPEGMPFTTDLLLELSKVNDEFLAGAVQCCTAFFEKNQSVIEISTFLTDLQGLQAQYPGQPIFKRLPKKSPKSSKSSSNTYRSATDWRELEEIARRQRQCIDEQRLQLDALAQEQDRLAATLARLDQEKRLLHQENLRLKALVDKLRLEDGVAVDAVVQEQETELRPAWRSALRPLLASLSPEIDAAIACKRAEGLDLRVVEEGKDWAVYDSGERLRGAVPEGNFQSLLEVIDLLELI
jgi:hypothetical protein